MKMPHQDVSSILFVCLGNICRSPLAEGVFRHVLHEADPNSRLIIDSAGTGAWHVGNPPDPRSIDVARRYGIDIGGQRARQVVTADFQRFDLILAMDADNMRSLKSHCPEGARAHIRLFLNNPDTQVPDPYYGSGDGFEQVYQMLLTGSRDLLRQVREPRP